MDLKNAMKNVYAVNEHQEILKYFSSFLTALVLISQWIVNCQLFSEMTSVRQVTEDEELVTVTSLQSN